MSYRQLTPEEEKLDESVWNSWEAFLFQMQASMDFVNTQTPLLNQDLEEQYHVSCGSCFNIDDLVRDCGNSIASTLELPQYCPKLLIWRPTLQV